MLPLNSRYWHTCAPHASFIRTNLTACGKVRTAGRHTLRLLTIGLALASSLYSQQAAHGPSGPLSFSLSSGRHPALCCSPLSSRDLSSLSVENFTDFPQALGDMSVSDSNQQQAPDKEHHESSATQGSPGHIFWVEPAFKVDYQHNFKPLTPREKFDEWARGAYDPFGLGIYAFESATLEHSSKEGFCGYGKGFGSYGECFGATELDANVSSFFGDFLFPVVMHQDARYFRLGQGSFGKRLGHAVSRVFVTHADSGRIVFFTSALSGTVLAAAGSNLYYPPQDRGIGPTLNRIALDLGDTALFNAAAEFWPDIKLKLYHAFGRE